MSAYEASSRRGVMVLMPSSSTTEVYEAANSLRWTRASMLSG